MAWLGTGRRRRVRLTVGVLLVAAVVYFIAAGTGSATRDANGSSSHVVAGGTAYFAEPPSAVPNYIFPFAVCRSSASTNISQFQELMYRPLYWFGKGATPEPQPVAVAARTRRTRTATPSRRSR